MHKNLISAALGAAMAVLCLSPAYAEWVPERPITLIIPYGAGGSTDIFGRVFASELAKETGWNVIVENRPGAGGVIGQLQVANAAPDGLTLGLSATTLFSLEPFMPDNATELKPDSVDFIGTLSAIPYAIIAASNAPFDDLAGLAAYSRENGPARMSSTAQSLTVAMEKLGEEMGISLVSALTSGSGESLQLVLGRHADVTISGGVHVPYILDGRMKVIAHFMEERADYAPDALTVAEQGGILPIRNYFILNAPKGMDPDTKATIVAAIDKAMQSDALKAHADSLYVTLDNLGPEGATADVMSQAETWQQYFAQ